MEINLLPWREEVIEYNKNFFTRVMLIALAASGIFLIFTYYLLFGQLSYTESYIQALAQAKVNLVDNVKTYFGFKTTQQEISSRSRALQSLQYSRFETIRLLNELVKITPKGVYLTQLIRKDNQVELSGTTNSNLLITKLMKSIDSSPELKTVSLQKVEKTEGKNLVRTQFDLTLAISMPPFAAKPGVIESNTNAVKNPITVIQQQQDARDKKIENVGKSP